MSNPNKKDPWIICHVCDGDGTTVNPAIDCNGLTAEDFDDDPEFAENYMDGVYNIPCRACGGRGSIRRSTVDRLEEAADARRLAAREDGDFEAYCGAQDHRWGR